jgi:hypothetical protein
VVAVDSDQHKTRKEESSLLLADEAARSVEQHRNEMADMWENLNASFTLQHP